MNTEPFIPRHILYFLGVDTPLKIEYYSNVSLYINTDLQRWVFQDTLQYSTIYNVKYVQIICIVMS